MHQIMESQRKWARTTGPRRANGCQPVPCSIWAAIWFFLAASDLSLPQQNSASGLSASQPDFSVFEPLYREALERREKELGPDHPKVAETLTNLALLLKN